MPTEILVTLIGTIGTLIGVAIQNYFMNKKNKMDHQENLELIAYKIDKLEKKQDKHNGMIERMYEVEKSVGVLNERQKQDRKDIDELEKKISWFFHIISF